MANTDKHYDLIIAGGGAVGLSLSAALRRALPACRCALFEPRPPSPAGQARPTRCISLSAKSLELFATWGIKLPSKHCQSIKRLRWQAPTSLELSAAQIERDRLGASVDYEILLSSLAQQAGELKAQALDSARVDSSGLWRLQSGSERYSCKLLILADGAPSKLAQSLGVEYTQRAYGQYASVARVRGPGRHHGVAWQLWRPEAVITLLPVTGAGSSYALIATGANKLSAEQLLAALATDSIEQFSGLQAQEQAQHFPLHYCRAWERGRRGLLLIGNAALNLHPMGAQSLNLHLRSLAALIAALSQHPLDSHACAHSYVTATEADFERTDFAVNKLVALAHSVRPRHEQLLAWGARALGSWPRARQRLLRRAALGA